MPEAAAPFLDEAILLTEAIQRLERDHKRELDRLKRQRRAQFLRANRAGATYPEIVTACGISDGLLIREMRTAKSETRAKSLIARPSQNPKLRPMPRQTREAS